MEVTSQNVESRVGGPPGTHLSQNDSYGSPVRGPSYVKPPKKGRQASYQSLYRTYGGCKGSPYNNQGQALPPQPLGHNQYQYWGQGPPSPESGASPPDMACAPPIQGFHHNPGQSNNEGYGSNILYGQVHNIQHPSYHYWGDNDYEYNVNTHNSFFSLAW